MSADRQKIAEAAQRYAAKNQYDLAIAEYQRLVQVDPGDVRALLKIGDLQVRSSANSQAVETYQRVGALYEQQGLHQKAIAVYKQILQINPDQLALYSRVADLHIKLGLTSDALQALELLAQRYSRNNDHQGLVNTFRQILLLDGQNLATRIRMGELLSKMGRGEEAATELEIACNILDGAGRIEEWARVAERVVFHRPSNVGVAKKLAAFYLDRNDARRALPRILACYKVSPRDVGTLELLASAFRAINQLPKTLSVLKEIAHIHQADGRTRERNEVYQRVLEIAPTDNEAREALRGGSKAGVKRPQSVPPPAVAPVPGSGAPSARHPSASLAPNDVEEVHDDAIEELHADDVGEAESSDVVFALSRPPPRDEDAEPPRAEIPRAPRVPRASSAAVQSPFIPRASELAGQGERGAAEAGRLLAEAEIFMKYGLRSKAMAHITRAAELDPLSVEVHARVRDVYVSMNDPAGVLRHSLRLAELQEFTDPQAALMEATRALDIDGENPSARALYERLGGMYEGEGDGALIDESEVAVDGRANAEVIPLPSTPADYFETGYDDQPYGEDMGDATEIGESPLAHFSTEEQPTAYRFPVDHIPVVVESDETVRGQSLRPSGGRANIEEALDEAEFFVTQGLYDDARGVLDDLLRTYPNHPLVMNRRDEVEQLASVQGGYEPGDPEYALADKIAEEVAGLNPYEGPPTGQIDVETVLAQFRQGVGRTVSIEDCDTHYDLGIAYKEMGLLDDAVAEFKIATMNPARQCIGETMIGLCYMEKGDVSSALEHFKQGLQAEQHSEREELGLYFEMGNAYESVGDLSEALYFFQKVDKRDPNFRSVRSRVTRLVGALHGVSEPRAPGRDDVDRSFDDFLKD